MNTCKQLSMLMYVFISLGYISRSGIGSSYWAFQASLSMGFSGQESWSRLPLPSPGDLPNPGIKPRSPVLQADTLTSDLPGKPEKPSMNYQFHFCLYIQEK